MDPASQAALAFIEGVQAARRELGAVRQHFSKRGLEVFGDSLCFGPIWGDDRLYFGIMVQGTDGRNYELLVCLHWTTSEWIIETDASIKMKTEWSLIHVYEDYRTSAPSNSEFVWNNSRLPLPIWKCSKI